jgi:putative flippase GtrA
MKINYVQVFQFFRYVFLGGIGAAIDLLSFYFLIKVFPSPLVANVVSTMLGILTSYLLNSRFTFKSQYNLNQILSFTGVGVLGILLSTLIVWAGVNLMSATNLFSKVISMPIVALFQFSLNNHFTFKQ